MKEPKLTLVGAGPGDPELITLKALRALSTADVVLYDALVSADILRLIPSGVPSFSVGKRFGEHSYSQEKINELIVEFAHRYGHVVRLKGGDPFLFGRGSEEMTFATTKGICSEVVPGISSALAVPAAAHIPVTARGMSESVWIITGTTRNGSLSSDIQLAAQSSATLVVLMGLNNLDEIVYQLRVAGRSTTPVAIIQNGTLPSQVCLIGTVDTILTKVKEQEIGAPAIIIIGEVVKSAATLQQVVHQSQSSA